MTCGKTAEPISSDQGSNRAGIVKVELSVRQGTGPTKELKRLYLEHYDSKNQY